MRRWWVAVAIVGAGGVAAVLLTDKGKESLRRWLTTFEAGSTTWSEWNEAAQVELEHIQSALNQIARGLETHGEPGA